MPNWKEVDTEIRSTPAAHDRVRRKYLMELHQHTGRNVILYYSGWQQKPWLSGQAVHTVDMNDSDKNAFMSTIHGMNRELGLDLFLHTPGGSIAAAESIVAYLRSMFGTNIRAIVPQMAMSAGTMVALACSVVVMGKHSSIGPIDPQFSGMPAHGILEEFNQAIKAVTKNPASAPIWQVIISKYPPTLIGRARKAIAWSREMVNEWLTTGMFDGEPDAKKKAGAIVRALGSHATMKAHERQVSCKKARELGIKVLSLEDEQKLQELVLTVHHATMQTLADSDVTKIVENHVGVSLLSEIEKV